MFGNLLKNVLVTAALVIAGTAATTGVAGTTIMLVASAGSGDFGVMASMGPGIVAVSAAVGVGFSFVTLFIAALTMPPVLLLARALKLPRPVTDMLGGAAAGLLCAAIALSGFTELARAKGGDVPDATMTYLMSSLGVLGGLLLGYWRYAVLVRAPIQLVARPAAA